MDILFWLATFLLVYSFVGYPLMVIVLAACIGRNEYRLIESSCPSVMFVFPVCFEGEQIKAKIANCKAIDYPRKKIQFVAVSDNATPETMEILRQAEREGILSVMENPYRSGKGVALARALKECTQEVFVVTDADTLLEPDHLRKLVAPFVDTEIGATTGVVRYANVGDSGISRNQGLYWRFEMLMRKAEGLFGRVVAITGAIYAIRPELFDLSDTHCDADFLAPIQVIAKGKKVLLLDAVCALDYSPTSPRSLLNRRTRMITFGLRSMIRNLQFLNPIRYPLLSWQLFSHKILRWFIAIPVLLVWVSSAFLLDHPFFFVVFAGQCLFYMTGILGGVSKKGIPVISSIWYFILSLWSSVVGILNIIRGRDYSVWQKTAQH